MRITQRAIADSNLRGINANLVALAQLQQQASSGIALNRPSDSPSGTATAMRTQGELDLNARFAANTDLAGTTLNVADSTLGSMRDLVARVRDLTVQGANTGVSSATANQALAREVDTLSEGLFALANQAVNGRPLLGGATSRSVAFVRDAAGVVTFAGRDESVDVRVSGSETIRTDVSGPEAVGPDGANVFSLLAGISDDLRTDPAALDARLVELDVALARLSDARTVVGVRTARLEVVSAVNAETKLNLAGQLSAVRDIDQAQTYMDVQLRQYGYQAALSASAKTLQTSLVDFLR